MRKSHEYFGGLFTSRKSLKTEAREDADKWAEKELRHMDTDPMIHADPSGYLVVMRPCGNKGWSHYFQTPKGLQCAHGASSGDKANTWKCAMEHFARWLPDELANPRD